MEQTNQQQQQPTGLHDTTNDAQARDECLNFSFAFALNRDFRM